jgi:hypothetical protein
MIMSETVVMFMDLLMSVVSSEQSAGIFLYSISRVAD